LLESRDILALFEVLSSHEVFTPPRIAREMLNLLPHELWRNPSLRILDPCTKSGVFLREAFFKLFEGLSEAGRHSAPDGTVYDLNDKRQRVNHILKNMIFGIATSEITGYFARRTLYGVMDANTDKQIEVLNVFDKSENFRAWSDDEKIAFLTRNRFNEYYDHRLFCTSEYKGFEAEGNIFYPVAEVTQRVVENGTFEIEDMYFPFVEASTKHPKILEMRDGQMKFDVIIGNPPYQLSDGGHSRSATPIYQKFVEQAIEMKPGHVVMITPSRWFAGGRGLQAYRARMLEDRQVRTIVDFANTTDAFPGVDIAGGVSYFHWQRGTKGPCRIVNVSGTDRLEATRALSDNPILVRDNRSVSIIDKVKQASNHPRLNTRVRPSKPFGLRTNYEPKKSGVPCWFIQKVGRKFAKISDVKDTNQILDRWKLLLPAAPIAGQTDFSKAVRFYMSSNIRIAAPGEACTESWIVAGDFDTEREVESFKSYIFTRTARFLLLQAVVSQHVTRDNFIFVPDLIEYDRTFTDDYLLKLWGLSQSDWEHICSRIQETS